MNHELTFHIIAQGHPYGLGATVTVHVEEGRSFVECSGVDGSTAKDIANFFAEALKLVVSSRGPKTATGAALVKVFDHLTPAER